MSTETNGADRGGSVRRRGPAWQTREVAGIRTHGQWVRDTRRNGYPSSPGVRFATVLTPAGMVAAISYPPSERDDGAVHFETMIGERHLYGWLDRWTSPLGVSGYARRWLDALHLELATDHPDQQP